MFICVEQVGGVDLHLISRVQKDKCKAGCLMSPNDITMTVFPNCSQVTTLTKLIVFENWVVQEQLQL